MAEAYLEAVEPAGKRFPLIGKLVSVGASVDCDIVIAAPTVSRRHANLMKAADSWAVQDAGSTNGTWVNGIKLLPGRSMCLVDGDHISFALERFFFSNGVGLLAPPIGANGQVPLIDRILALDPFDFERLVGSLFEKLGFNVEVTKPTGDGGIDVQAEKIATGTHELPYRGKYFIQCKRFKPGNKISNGDILKFVGAIATMGGKGIFVTTSTFTTPAQEVAETAGINLIDGKELERLLKRFGLV